MKKLILKLKNWYKNYGVISPSNIPITIQTDFIYSKFLIILIVLLSLFAFSHSAFAFDTRNTFNDSGSNYTWFMNTSGATCHLGLWKDGGNGIDYASFDTSYSISKTTLTSGNYRWVTECFGSNYFDMSYADFISWQSGNLNNYYGGGDAFVVGSSSPVLGCMDSTATNYNSLATQDDGSCILSSSYLHIWDLGVQGKIYLHNDGTITVDNGYGDVTMLIITNDGSDVWQAHGGSLPISFIGQFPYDTFNNVLYGNLARGTVHGHVCFKRYQYDGCDYSWQTHLMTGDTYDFSNYVVTNSSSSDLPSSTSFMSFVPSKPLSIDGNLIIGDSTISGLLSTSSLYVGQVVHGVGLLEGTTISSITNSSTIEVSQSAVLTTKSSLVFMGTLLVTYDTLSQINGLEVPTNMSSSSVGADIFIKSSDWVDGMYLDISFTNEQVENVGGSALGAWNSAFGGNGDNGGKSLQIPITSADLDKKFEARIPVTFQNIGASTATFRLKKPSDHADWWLIGGLFPDNTVLIDTFNFVIGKQTTFDNLTHTANEGQGGGAKLALSIATGRVQIDHPECEILTFSLSKCAYTLVMPSAKDLQKQWIDFKTNALTIFPLGYITRFLTIFSTTSAVMPPPLHYTFGSSSTPDLQGKEITFQIWNRFDTLNGIKSDQGDNKNIWDIVMPYFKIVVAFAVLFVILDDLLGIQFQSDFTQSSNNSYTVDSKTGIRTDVKETHQDSNLKTTYKNTSFNKYNSVDHSVSRTSSLNPKHKMVQIVKHKAGRGSRRRINH